jgi:glycosyltransferase involved in cell wall biosynthesis
MISVITITYNNPNELKKTLASIKDIDDIESIVVDGGNNEETLSILKKHKGKFIHEKDEGISDAFNKGIRQASGSAIALLHSGDICIDKNYYLWADKVFIQNPEIDFVYSDIFYSDPLIGLRKMKAQNASKINFGIGIPFPHLSLIVRKQVFEKIGYYSLNYKIAMDVDFEIRLIKANLKGIYYPFEPPIIMDGNGISRKKVFEGIKESKQALIDNDVFYGKNKISFYIRYFRCLLSQLIRKFL